MVLYSIARGAGSGRNLAASSCIISRYCSRAEDDFAILQIRIVYFMSEYRGI